MVIGSEDWNVVMRKARGNRDMQPARATCWPRVGGGNINVLDRVDCKVNYINEVAGKKGN